MEDCSIFNSNKSKFCIDLEYLDSTLNYRKILPYCGLAILCVLRVSLGRKCFPKFFGSGCFRQGENCPSPSLLPIYFLFCVPLCHTFIFSCTSVGVCNCSSKKSLNVHTHTHPHWLTFSPTSSAVALKKHSGSTSQTVMHVAGLLYCSLFGLKNLLSAGHSGVKKKVSGLALSSCFSGEYKVPVDQVQTSGCLREGEKKS